MQLSSDVADKKICAALLHTFLMDISSIYFDDKRNEDNAVVVIMKECCFDWETTKLFANMYQALFSEKNTREWNRKYQSGLNALGDVDADAYIEGWCNIMIFRVSAFNRDRYIVNYERY